MNKKARFKLVLAIFLFFFIGVVMTVSTQVSNDSNITSVSNNLSYNLERGIGGGGSGGGSKFPTQNNQFVIPIQILEEKIPEEVNLLPTEQIQLEKEEDNLTEVMLRRQSIDFGGSISEKLKSQQEVKVVVVFKDIKNVTLRDQIVTDVLSNLSQSDFRGNSNESIGSVYVLDGYITKEGLEKLRNNPFIWGIYEPGIMRATLENATKNQSGITLLLNEAFVELDSDKKIGEVAGVAPDSVFWFFDTFVERVQLFLTFDVVKKVELRLKIADERLAEIELMAKTNKNLEREKAEKAREKEIEELA
ncbi:hypothetical protein HY643_04565, partial [Candidatus Woesearchaeota archaeon]|nr:hypothetical protein [Candidatus Woesearchaeota archaeon]